jgi:hypothetical protein
MLLITVERLVAEQELVQWPAISQKLLNGDRDSTEKLTYSLVPVKIKEKTFNSTFNSNVNTFFI